MRDLRAMIAASVLGFAAMTGGAAAETVLNYAWNKNVGPLNPHMYSPSELIGQAMVYEPLVKYQDGGTVIPWLAESWTVSDDGKVYEFTLRPGVTFSDGTPFDAAAVMANVDALMANRERHGWLEMFQQFDTIEATGPMTVRFTLKSAYYPFLQDLALVRPFRFMSPTGMEDGHQTKDGVKAPIGTGPWVLDEIRMGEYDIFRANTHYWGGKPGYDTIRFKVLPDANTRALALESGEVDLIAGTGGQLTPDAFGRLRDGGQFGTAVSQPYSTRMITMHSGHGPTADLAVRRAINTAIDRDLIVEQVLYGQEPRADTLFSPNLPYTDIGVTPWAYDPAAAAAMLDEAGWVLDGHQRVKDGAPLAIDLYFTADDPDEKAISEVIQAELADIGIKLNIIGEEKSAIYARQKDGTFGMIYADTYGPPYDPHSFSSSMRRPSHADYAAQSGLPMKAQIDSRIGAALTSTDETQRAEDWKYVLTTLHEQAVYLPISYKTAIMAHAPSVGGAAFGATIHEFPFEKLHPEGK